MANLKSKKVKKNPVMLPKNEYLGFFTISVVLLFFLLPLFLPFGFRPVLKKSFKFSFGK